MTERNIHQELIVEIQKRKQHRLYIFVGSIVVGSALVALSIL